MRIPTDPRVLDQHREIALECGEKQLENLANGSVDKDLAVVGGISTDKIRDYEGWKNRRGGEENLGDCLIEVAERIIRRGGKFGLQIEGPGGDPVESASTAYDPVENARDVTPQRGTQSLSRPTGGQPFP